MGAVYVADQMLPRLRGPEATPTVTMTCSLRKLSDGDVVDLAQWLTKRGQFAGVSGFGAEYNKLESVKLTTSHGWLPYDSYLPISRSPAGSRGGGG